MKKFEIEALARISIPHTFNANTLILTLRINDEETKIQLSLEDLIELKFGDYTEYKESKSFISMLRSLKQLKIENIYDFNRITNGFFYKLMQNHQNFKKNEELYALLYPTKERICKIYDNSSENIRNLIKENYKLYEKFLTSSVVYNFETLEDPGKYKNLINLIKLYLKKSSLFLSEQEIDLIFNYYQDSQFQCDMENFDKNNENKYFIDSILNKLLWLSHKSPEIQSKGNYQYLINNFRKLYKEEPRKITKYFNHWAIKSFGNTIEKHDELEKSIFGNLI